MKLTNMNFKSICTQVGLLIFIALITFNCTPIDHYYSDYLDNAEKSYPGRVDSIQFKPGNNRAAIQSLISTDSRIKKMTISWGQNEFFETDITSDDIANYKEVIIPNIAEGIYTFDIRTLDEEGNKSVRTEIFGRVYGEQYEANLNNRLIDYIKREANDLVINWIPESRDTTLIGTTLSYENSSGEEKEVFLEGDKNEIVLSDYQNGTNFSYATLFKPESIAIDTFSAGKKIINPLDYLVLERYLYNRESWSIEDFSSQEPNNSRFADRLLDNDNTSYWITRYSVNATDYPDHFVTVDMGEQRNVDGFFFIQKDGDRKIRELEIHVSIDGSNWENLGLFGLTNEGRNTEQFIDINEQKSIRYFKIVPTAGHDSQKQPGLAELGAYYYN